MGLKIDTIDQTSASQHGGRKLLCFQFRRIVSHIDKHQLSQKVKFVRASLAQKVSVRMVSSNEYCN